MWGFTYMFVANIFNLKKLMKKSILALSVFSLLFTACKKDKDEPANVTPTVQNLSGRYKLAQIAAKVGSSPEQNVTDSYLESCEKDDIYTLNVNLTLAYQDAGTVCNPSESYDSDWKLNSSTSIELDGDTYTIRKFNGTSLELTENYGGGTLITYLTKQ
jgi:hypothetical protein